VVGLFDSSGSPTIQIEVYGWNSDIRRSVTAIVDTGFTGFLMLPILTAFPIGLILHSLMDITLADGSIQNKLTCRGGVHFDGQTRPGLIILEEQGTEVLVGIEFLKSFGLTLIVDPARNQAVSTLRLSP
jgi:predicted aspartyl protease